MSSVNPIYWAKNVLYQKYGERILKDVDIDGDGKPDPVQDYDNNGIDNGDFIEYISRHQACLASKITFVRSISGLRADNIINQLLYMESETGLFTPEQTKEASQKLVSLLNDIKAELKKPENKGLSIVEKIQLAYKMIWIKFDKAVDANHSFTRDLLKRILDCDASSFVIIALAGELGHEDPEWKEVTIGYLPGHAFIRYCKVNIDVGKIFPDVLYSTLFSVKPTFLKGSNILALFYANRGIVFTEIEQYGRAIEDYSKALELNPIDVSSYYNRGQTFCLIEQYKRAIENYNKAIELYPNFATYYFDRGNAFLQIKYYYEAIKDYNRAIELFPDDARFYYNRGIAFTYIKDYYRAIEDYDKAIKLNPNYVDAYVNRASIEAYYGDKEKAARDLARAKELGYSGE
jgi:tetratricopeptide (TPR) repeat protein